MNKKRNFTVLVVIASITFAIVTISTILSTYLPANASCGDRPGTPDEVRAEPSPDSPTSAIRFSWRNTTGRWIEEPNGYFDIYFRDGNGLDINPNLTGYGPYKVSYHSQSYYDLTGLSPTTTRCFSIRARTEGGTEGCISDLHSDWACATTLTRKPVIGALGRISQRTPTPATTPSPTPTPTLTQLTCNAHLTGGSTNTTIEVRIDGTGFVAGEPIQINQDGNFATKTVAGRFGEYNVTISVFGSPPGTTRSAKFRAIGLNSGRTSPDSPPISI